MRFVATAAGVLLACSVFAANTPKGPAYTYNMATETKFTAKVVDVREVVKDHALTGIFLTVSVKEEKFDMYVGPKDFVKMFDVNFKPGDEIDVIASKVPYEAGEIFLAREIAMGKLTLSLRDETGWPNWDWNKPTTTSH